MEKQRHVVKQAVVNTFVSQPNAVFGLMETGTLPITKNLALPGNGT